MQLAKRDARPHEGRMYEVIQGKGRRTNMLKNQRWNWDLGERGGYIFISLTQVPTMPRRSGSKNGSQSVESTFLEKAGVGGSIPSLATV